MALQTIDQIMKRAGKLTPSERLLLASRLIQGVRSNLPPVKRAENGVMLADFCPTPHSAWMLSPISANIVEMMTAAAQFSKKGSLK